MVKPKPVEFCHDVWYEKARIVAARNWKV